MFSRQMWRRKNCYIKQPFGLLSGGWSLGLIAGAADRTSRLIPKRIGTSFMSPSRFQLFV